ncbi:zinc finger CCCH domain-containing protein 58 [Hibiscus syriacus]|uniref:Zinc finger CCCH domain-containing protein 58 n=1 Tax=Hibiscus syriacus TaxID=106335 RepID=A0A6A2WLN3_HIBSY|nr:zinc finger CCCH domain-containing protein 58 [Hibiscus syriacus]
MTKLPLQILLCLLLSLISSTTAEIKTLTITSDSRPMILFEKFGFTHNGYVSVSVSSVSVTSSANDPNPDASRLGFFLMSEEALLQVLLEIQQNPHFCVLDSRYIQHLFTFADLSPPPLSRFNRTYRVSSPNEYSLFFSNCAPQTRISMNVRTEIYNLERDGSKDYLSAGLTHLPSLYTVFSIFYLVLLGCWIYVCYTNKRSVHRIHLLMSGLLLFKALNLICAAEDKHFVKVTGTPHGWDKGEEGFDDRDPAPSFSNIASIVIGETGPFIKDWVTWNQLFLLIDIICCCAIIFPIVWSIRSLRETSKTDGKAARNLAKLTLFRQFYIVVIGYLYFTRIVVFALRTIAAYKYQWVSNAAEETASFAFYLVMFYMFRPVEKNEYFILDEEDEEAAEIALRDEEFDL